TVTEPVTDIRLDTPAGLVLARVRVVDGHAESVTLRNVDSFAYELDARIEVPGYGAVPLDVAFGGNFYAITELADLGIEFEPGDARVRQRMLDAGLAIMDAVSDRIAPKHPEQPEIVGCHHVYLTAPGSTAAQSRHAMAIHPGWFDRSPCGTGTSARMAQLHARGELDLHADFVNESIIGSRFVGRLVDVTSVGGRPAVVPTVTGRAWLTGMGQYLLDPTDPFPAGFQL
ncbi:MAG: proline racemase, partial [Pseudonocardiales bacterium]|nr:proline racemase [Pseudonocardiales bacterium]